MKTGYPMVQRVALIAAALFGMVATASLSAAEAKDSSGDGGKEPKGATTIVLEQPIARVQQAAVNALAVIGCKIRKNEATYLEGKRSNKVGLAVGSGGETIKVWLTADGPTKTSLKVATAKSMMGYVGQRSWNEAVVQEIQKDLAGTTSVTPPAVVTK